MNRVNVPNGEYARISQGGSIRNIIYQQGQFDCAREQLYGKYNPQNVYNMTPTDIHYYIADWAISGNRLNEIGECLWYLNPFKPTCSNTFPSNGSGTLHTRLIVGTLDRGEESSIQDNYGNFLNSFFKI